MLQFKYHLKAHKSASDELHYIIFVLVKTNKHLYQYQRNKLEVAKRLHTRKAQERILCCVTSFI